MIDKPATYEKIRKAIRKADAIYMDVSGSMTGLFIPPVIDDAVANAGSTSKYVFSLSVQETLHPTWTSAVLHRGGGGTNLRQVICHIESHHKGERIVILTDMLPREIEYAKQQLPDRVKVICVTYVDIRILKGEAMPSPPDVHLVLSERYARLVKLALSRRTPRRVESLDAALDAEVVEACKSVIEEIDSQLSRDSRSMNTPLDTLAKNLREQEGVTDEIREAMGMKSTKKRRKPGERERAALDAVKGEQAPSKAAEVADKMAKAAKKAVDTHEGDKG